ncbi:WD40 repeat domain-containing protein [Bradyrhizobium betae]|uniref:WD40 repeat domain-containing protein n=1 Tax=Bradyrhizobium betae TaxID=244734 RepID=UPI003D67A514
MRFWPIDLDLRFSFFWIAFGWLATTTACHAEGALPAPSAKPPVVPTFEKLPHIPLPKGDFIAWCGDRERYLFATDGEYIDAYDRGTKISAPSPTGSRWVQCGTDGQYVVFPEDDAGRVRRFELETGKSAILATFDGRSGPGIGIAFSPDMKTVASDKPLQLTAEAGELRTISVPVTTRRPVSKIVWSPDSSKFFVGYSDTVDVMDAQGKRIGGGKVRKDSVVTAGWFDAEQKSLFLFLFSDDIQGIGSFVRCRIADWRCVQLKERVEQAASGGKGLIGIVGPIDRPKLPDDDSSVPYARYAAELRDNSFRLLFRQEFALAAGQTSPRLYVSPSAATAVLSWRLTERAKCPDPANDKCQPGWILDIGKAIK